MAAATSQEINLLLHPKQAWAFNSPATEILFGGAAGGGKSYWLRVCAIAWCLQIPGLQCWLFRKKAVDLIDTHLDGPGAFRDMLAPMVKTGEARIVTAPLIDIKFQNGSAIHLRHAQDMDGARSKEFHVLLPDELTEFTEAEYRFLRSRVRMDARTRARVPAELQGRFPRIVAGSNPTGVGHSWVKAAFVDPVPYSKLWRTPKSEGGFLRQYVPSLLQDNPSLSYEEYSAALSGLGSPEMVRAMLEGDWSVVSGAAFENLLPSRHRIRAFTPPRHWTRFTALDWGTAKPFSMGWYCVAEGATLLKAKGDWPELWLPDGAVIRYREFYGWNGKPDTGCRMNSHEFADAVLAMELDAGDIDIDYRVADAAIWAQVDGPSVAENIQAYRDKGGRGLRLQRSEKGRAQGYQEVRRWLDGEDGRPNFYVTESCPHFWRTVPGLMLDEINPEKGPDTKQEDHVYDEVQMALMSRPRPTTERQRIETAFWDKRRKDGMVPTGAHAYAYRQRKKRP